MLLGEGTFHYDESRKKVYATSSGNSVTCSTSDVPDAPADVPPGLTLLILDEITWGSEPVESVEAIM